MVKRSQIDIPPTSQEEEEAAIGSGKEAASAPVVAAKEKDADVAVVVKPTPQQLPVAKESGDMVLQVGRNLKLRILQRSVHPSYMYFSKPGV